MNSLWSQVPLSELVTRERRPVEVDPKAEYAEIGIYSFGRGIFHKSPRTGFEVGNKKLFLIREGDFIFQITFAWEGAVGLASAAEDGMYGSVRFPTFRVDESRCYSPFLLNYFKTKPGREQLVRICPGSAGRNRVLSIKRFPEVIIPLPPLEEQRRIVARIEELAAKVEAARALRQQAIEETGALIAAALGQVFDLDFEVTKLLSQVVKEGGKQVSASDHGDDIYLSLGDIQANTGKVLRKRSASTAGVHGSAVRFGANSVLFSKLRPYLNKVAVPTFSGIGTTELVVLEPEPNVLERGFFAWFLRSPKVVGELVQHSAGTKMPRANLKVFRSLLVPIPSLSEQRRIVAYLDDLQAKVEAVKQHQAATGAALNVLLPSILDRAFKGEL